MGTLISTITSLKEGEESNLEYLTISYYTLDYLKWLSFGASEMNTPFNLLGFPSHIAI